MPSDDSIALPAQCEEKNYSVAVTIIWNYSVDGAIIKNYSVAADDDDDDDARADDADHDFIFAQSERGSCSSL